ncbi:MAG: N-acetyl-gamma-glutamyl-phosphate reductase [Candidatus Bathyarchaeota archaeon]|nr:N-acetyl-gamma-glutamyl-phosphate reductase [Candidatus Bathyarchaeota archaeon]
MRISIIGASGYAGGELIRELLSHPEVEITNVVSRSHVDEYVFRIHPNLRGYTELKFSPLNLSSITSNSDLVFTSVPHGTSTEIVPKLLSTGIKVIDLGADFRLKDPADYPRWYGWTHSHPELLTEAVYGLPELHREKIRKAKLVACPGCMATATILALAPPIKEQIIEPERIVVDAKIGSSGAGNVPTKSSHHPERASGVRPYKTIGHRHIAEMEQELSLLTNIRPRISFSPHAVPIIRGILATVHTFTKKELELPELWKMYRSMYGKEPFVRLIRDRKGLHQLPDPKVTTGSNFCDIGFELDPHINRLVILSAIDNLVKGASGQAVQCLNIMLGIDEKTGIPGPTIYPV